MQKSKARKRACDYDEIYNVAYPEVSDKLEQRELALLHLIHSGVNNSRLSLLDRQASALPRSQPSCSA